MLSSFGSWSVNLLFVVSATPGEVGVTLKQGYNGDLSSKQAGSVGGQMVKNVCPARLLKNVQFMRENRVVNGRKTVVKYIVGVAV